MQNETDRPAVRQREDTWIEIPARYIETGHASSPVEIRPGTDEGTMIITQTSPHCEVSIADLKQAVGLIRASEGAAGGVKLQQAA